MDEVVVSPLLARYVADRAPKFALEHDESVVQHRPALTTRHGCEVRHEVCQSCVQLSRRRINSGIGSINVLMIVPTTQCDLDVPRAELCRQDIAGGHACVSKRAAAVPLLIGG